MNNEERLERLNVILDDLAEMCADRVLLVEGPKDRMAMVLLGVNAEMLSVQSEGGPLKVAEKLYEKQRNAVIMTDWDRQGDEIANDLERSLSSLCVKYDVAIRSKLRWICGNEIYDVESLPAFYCRLVTESVRRNEGKNK
jgi:dTMP kinase